MNKELNIDHQTVDRCIARLETIYKKPEEIFVIIGRLRAIFIISKSCFQNSLLEAVEQYEIIYRQLLTLSKELAAVLRIASDEYRDMDQSISYRIRQEG